MRENAAGSNAFLKKLIVIAAVLALTAIGLPALNACRSAARAEEDPAG